MYVFICDYGFAEQMCCIYDAWVMALKEGHDNVRLMRGPVNQLSILDEYIYVERDDIKYQKVINSIKQKISWEAYMYVYYASLSADDGALDAIYRFLIKGFRAGGCIVNQHTDADVSRLIKIKLNVANEAHHFIEFVRFNSINNRLYISHIEPVNDVTAIVADHFEDRMPSEHWIIIDDIRKYGVVHTADGGSYIRWFTDEEFEQLKKTELYEDKYTDMWRTFFDAISIKQRYNPRCQNTLMPKRKRKHMTEFVQNAQK